MGLKQDIIIRNEYTLQRSDGSGSRGATPGRYVLRYMARDHATQTLAPVKKYDLDQFVMRYMARADAVQKLTVADDFPTPSMRRKRKTRTREDDHVADDDNAHTLIVHNAPDDMLAELERTAQRTRALLDVMDGGDEAHTEPSDSNQSQGYITKKDVKRSFKEAQRLGGIAFTHGDVSMSHEKLHRKSADIQTAFQAGKTVMKTVLSFSHDYLVQHNIVRDDLEIRRRGDYRGQIDEMKLRMGIMAGLDRMARTSYDDLDYIGVIQVDTKNVHAHLVMVDRGTGTIMKDGTQRGKINLGARSHLRRGMDSYLDEHSHIAHYSSAVHNERANVVSYIKSWAMNTIVREVSAQYIVSQLPTDETQWRAGSHRESMKRANHVMRTLVEDRLADPDSPMADAMASIERYARRRATREDLTRSEQQQLIDNGRTRIVDQAMNGVYTILAAIPREQRERISTPMMTVLSMDMDELLESVRTGAPGAQAESERSDDTGVSPNITLGQFGMRVRTYSSRRAYHREQRAVYETAARDWEKAYDDGRAQAASRVMWEHAQIEADYHGRAAQKYEQILGAVTDDPRWEEQWERVASIGDDVLRLRALRKDKSIARMRDEDAAEKYGMQMYGQPGGGSLARTGREGKIAREIIDARLSSLEDDYARSVDALNRQWLLHGAHIDVDDENRQYDQKSYDYEDQGIALRRCVLPPTYDDDSDESRSSIHNPAQALRLVYTPEYRPEEVQGVDMHDMRSEITESIPVGKKVQKRFMSLTAARRRALDRARAFLMQTGQGEYVDSLASAERDISRAENTVDILKGTSGVLTSEIAQRVERLRRQKQRTALRSSHEAMAEDGVDVPSDSIDVESARDTYTDAADGIGYTFELDTRVRARVHEEIDTVAHSVAQDITQERDRDGRLPGH